MIAAETWKFVVGYEGCYEVSDAGAVRRTRGQILTPESGRYGHQSVVLHSGLRCRAWVHRLVLEAFVGRCPPGMECRHCDGNPQNNRLDNLAWGTPLENVADRKLHGRDTIGERNGLAKLTASDVAAMRRLRFGSGMTYLEIGDLFGVARQVASKAINGRTWSHVA